MAYIANNIDSYQTYQKLFFGTCFFCLKLFVGTCFFYLSNLFLAHNYCVYLASTLHRKKRRYRRRYMIIYICISPNPLLSYWRCSLHIKAVSHIDRRNFLDTVFVLWCYVKCHFWKKKTSMLVLGMYELLDVLNILTNKITYIAMVFKT